MFKVNKDDILLIKTYKGTDRLMRVLNYFISPINSEIVLLLKDCYSNAEGLFREDSIIGKVQLKGD